jgi:hypothetical protein
MTNVPRFLAGAAAIGALATPAAAQYQYPQQQYQQQYQYPQQTYPQAYPGYPQQGYGYNQGYNQNPIGQIIDQLLGNRYSVTDRTAVSQCASAAMRQSAAQYGGNGNNRGYNQGYDPRYGQNQGYMQTNRYRVTSITNVERRSNGLRVSGTLSSGGGYGGYNQGYANRGYDAANLSFRCNVDYRGAVTNVRVRPTEYSQGY